jgi:hypothetical protein
MLRAEHRAVAVGFFFRLPRPFHPGHRFAAIMRTLNCLIPFPDQPGAVRNNPRGYRSQGDDHEQRPQAELEAAAGHLQRRKKRNSSSDLMT